MKATTTIAFPISIPTVDAELVITAERRDATVHLRVRSRSIGSRLVRLSVQEAIGLRDALAYAVLEAESRR